MYNIRKPKINLKDVFTILLLFAIVTNSYSKDTLINDRLVELGEIYRNFMFRNNPPSGTLENMENLKTGELNLTVDFIEQTITSGNKLLEEKYLKLPDTASLKFIYIIRQINQNLSEENPRDNHELVSEKMKDEIKYYALVDNYYDMLFIGVGNKNQPFDLSDVNFNIADYNLKNETEEGIFFLSAMELCGMTIWGYMNIVKPPNYKAAMDKIKKFPTFNGQPYYQFLGLNFPDFKIKILKDEDEMSYKEYYIDKYLNTLIYHYMCLNQKKKYKEEKMDLTLGSILKEEKYYKYSKNYKEQLESLFRKEKY